MVASSIITTVLMLVGVVCSDCLGVKTSMHALDNMKLAERKHFYCQADSCEHECTVGMRLTLGHHIATFSVK